MLEATGIALNRLDDLWSGLGHYRSIESLVMLQWEWIDGVWHSSVVKPPELIPVPGPCSYCGGPQPWPFPFRMCSECLRKGDDTYWSGEEVWETPEHLAEVDKKRIPMNDKQCEPYSRPQWVLKGNRLGIGYHGFAIDLYAKMKRSDDE